jgi:hypothetical protein
MSSDAPHLALPFADLVMYDGAELSKAIAASLGDTEAALLARKRKSVFSQRICCGGGSGPQAVFRQQRASSQLDLFTNNQPVK